MLAGKWGLGWTDVRNPHVAAQLRGGEHCFLTARESCDCGTALGVDGPNAATPEHLPPDAEADPASLADDERWLGFLATALGDRIVPSVGLFVHNFSGSPESEAVELQGRRRMAIGELNEAYLRSLPYDLLHDFRA